MSMLSQPYFHDEAAAFSHVESILWPEGPVCPHCGSMEKCYKLEGTRTKASLKNPEGIERHGLWKCSQCRKQFTVRKNTIFEESHLPLHKWLQAIYLMCASKKGFSAKQMERTLEVQYKTAWFLCHRIRLAMADGSLNPFGGNGGDVEVDETFIGKDPEAATGKRMAPWQERNKVLTLIDRRTGQARSVVIDDLKSSTIGPIVQANVAYDSRILTDEAPRLRPVGGKFAVHKRVNHAAEEWVSREDRTIHTNTVEGYFSVFKRGMKGTYQHCSKKHLHRYLAEFDYRYNNRSALGIEDEVRTQTVIRNSFSKRLYYRQPA